MFSIPYDIKEKLHNDEAQINIRIHFPNGERTDICNDLIVSGSAKLTESLCSQNELKFGLCESPVFECETVGVGNIKDAAFDLTYEILCEPNVAGSVWKTDIQQFVFEIPMGKFIVQSCERQADLQHRKIMAYGGGAVTKWEMPSSEKSKMIHWRSANKSLIYKPDLYKIIQTFFELEKKTQIELNETNIIARPVSIKIRNLSFTFNIIGMTKSVISPTTDKDNVIFKDFYDVISTPLECLKKCVNNLISNVTNEEMQLICDTFVMYSAYYTRNSIFENGVYYFFEKGMNYYDKGIDRDYYSVPRFSCGVICTYNGQTEKHYYLDNLEVYTMGDDSISYPISVSYADRENYIKTDLQATLQSICEIYGKIGRINRYNQLLFVELKKQFYLMPSDDLHPAEQLRPLGVVGDSISKSMYSDCWYDEAYTKPYGAVYCEYKDTNNQQQAVILYCEGYDDESYMADYQIYDISSNDIIKNSLYTTEQIVTIMQNIADAISNVTYVPVDAKTVALPYVECGDTLEVLTENNDSINTIVLKRVLSGESYVVDEFISK